MKLFSWIFIGLLFSGFLLSVLWIGLPHGGKPKVIKIYKAIPYELRQINREHAERYDAINSPTNSKTGHPTGVTKTLDDVSTLFADEGLSAEEETDFWKWFAAQETENSTLIESFNETAADSMITDEGDRIRNIDYEELVMQVTSAYNLLDVLESYDIYFSDKRGMGTTICPFCYQNTFRTFVNANTGHRGIWHCNNCSQVPRMVIDFVARIEDISRNQAVKYLAERAGLLK